MNKTEKYHPSLFEKAQETITVENNEPVIPQSTLYDTPIQMHHMPMKKHVTIFGYSQQNRENILEQVAKITKVFRKEEGKNYMNVWADDISSLDALLKMNHKIMNGEMIGVYRRGYGVVDGEDIYYKKKGVFKKVYEYFFGE
jgi:hypothetical protein